MKSLNRNFNRISVIILLLFQLFYAESNAQLSSDKNEVMSNDSISNFIENVDNLVIGVLNDSVLAQMTDSIPFTIYLTYYFDFFNRTELDSFPYNFLYVRAINLTLSADILEQLREFLQNNEEFKLLERNMVVQQFNIQDKYGGRNTIQAINLSH
jgi:hypothetical protein